MRYQLTIASLLTLAVLFCTRNSYGFEGDFSFTQANSTVFFNSQIDLEMGEILLATTWEFGDGENSTHTNPVHPYPSFGTYTCCLEVKVERPDGSICIGEVCKDVLLTESMPCSLDVTLNASKLPDGMVQFEVVTETDGSTELSNVLWDFGDGTASTALIPDLHQYAGPGTYLACVSAEATNFTNVCSDAFCQTIEIEPFSCSVKAQVDIVTSECGLHAEYSDNVLGMTHVDAVSWSINGLEASHGHFIATGAEDGDVLNVCLSVEASSPGSVCAHTECREVVVSCTDESDDKKTGGPVSIGLGKSTSETLQLSVFPNPAQEVFTIEMEDLLEVSVVDLGGREVYSGSEFRINCSDWKPGIYLIRAQTSSGRKTTRLIKS